LTGQDAGPDRVVIPSEAEGSRSVSFKVGPRDSSTSLRFVQNDIDFHPRFWTDVTTAEYPAEHFR